METKSKYEIKEFPIEKLYVNPDNDRFINSEELPDEFAAIKELIHMDKTTHIDRLAKDIALHGLNPNELPIVIPSSDVEGRFLVMDGNRRISSIKLMTQYRKELNDMEIDSTIKRNIMSLNCEIKNVTCVLYDKENDVIDLIEKLHTSKPGVSQVKWDPQVQDRHQAKNGLASKRLAIIEMLRCSRYTSIEVRNILDEEGWTSKLKRFVSKSYMDFFGIQFDKENNILLYLEESEVIKGLSQLAFDLKSIHANLIAQTKDVRDKYIENFPLDKIPDRKRFNKLLVIFNFKSKQFIVSDIENDRIDKSDGTTDSNICGTESSGGENNKQGNKNQNSSKEDVNGKGESGNKEKEDNDNKNNSGNVSGDNSEKEKKTDSSKNRYKSTDERTTLIPKEEDIPIKNQRTLDLYKELKMINVNLYTNTVSIAFRSLLEFSFNYFLEKRNNKWAKNEQITLFKKLDKVIKILENEIGKNKLMSEIPAIYSSIESYNALEKKGDIISITNLNIIIHNYNYHVTDKELKHIYNNYSPLLSRIWE